MRDANTYQRLIKTYQITWKPWTFDCSFTKQSNIVHGILFARQSALHYQPMLQIDKEATQGDIKRLERMLTGPEEEPLVEEEICTHL